MLYRKRSNDMIAWKGWGLLVLVVIAASAILGDLIIGLVTGNSTFSDAHRWTIALKAIPAGIAVWFLGRYLANRKAKTVVDVETGETLVLKQEHSLMFIKMHWWGPILIAIGVGNVIAEFAK
jgi:hypothetical protein